MAASWYVVSYQTIQGLCVVSKRNETTRNSSREETIRGISCRMDKDGMGRDASSRRQLLIGLASSVSSSMDGTEY